MTSWLTTLPCTRAEADRAKALEEPFGFEESAPTLVACEVANGWELQLYTDDEPLAGLMEALAGLAPSSAQPPHARPIEEQDWVTLSQAGLEPVDAGRFHIHTAEHAGKARPGQIAIRIDAGLAFGTGQHATTHGCLEVISSLANHRAYRNILDLGTGSGLLAFAAQRLWRRARITGSDIDPVATDVARTNARQNGVPSGRQAGAVHLIAASGFDHRDLARRAPYDLILANILAGPLVALAPGICAALAPGGTLVLAGLIASQARRVEAAYRARGLVPVRPTPKGEWPVLVFTKPGGAAVARSVRGTAGPRPKASVW